MRNLFVLMVAVLLSQTALAAPPNVLFVLIDDMGYADLSCYGEKRVHTDHIDQLAKEGIRFTQFYVNCPICSPSRTALTTGQYPARWKMTSYLDNRAVNKQRGMPNWLDPAAPTIARQMKAAGYTTGHFGKWHMGGQRDVGDAPLVADYGFDKVLTSFEGLGDRILPLMDAYDGKPAHKSDLGILSERLGHGNITWMNRSEVTTGYANAALAFIQQCGKDNKPFYVNLWPDDVHSPFFPPKALRGDGSKKQLYLGVVQATDDQLAPLLDYIRNSPKLRDNTLIVLASDNGPEPGAGSAGIFKGHKGNLYEGGIREPLITWGPGLLAKDAVGKTNEKSVIAGVDFLPTVLALAGQKPAEGQHTDGVDMSASWLGKEQQVRSQPLFWIRPPDRPGPKEDRFPDLAVRDGDWKLLINEDGSKPQLYDLVGDVTESKNLAGEHADVVGRLKKELMDWRKTMPVDIRMKQQGADLGDVINDAG